jgi:hypothetical protein
VRELSHWELLSDELSVAKLPSDGMTVVIKPQLIRTAGCQPEIFASAYEFRTVGEPLFRADMPDVSPPDRNGLELHVRLAAERIIFLLSHCGKPKFCLGEAIGTNYC